MTDNKFPKKELIILAVGEAVCVLLTVLSFFAVSISGIIQFEFSYKVVTGAILGAAVVLLNFIFLSLSVNKAVDEFMALRGDGEMTDEEAEAFAAKNSAIIQNAVKKSFIVRVATIALALVVAFLADWFNPLATVVPIIAYQPILTWGNHLVESAKKIISRVRAQKADGGESMESEPDSLPGDSGEQTPDLAEDTDSGEQTPDLPEETASGETVTAYTSEEKPALGESHTDVPHITADDEVTQQDVADEDALSNIATEDNKENTEGSDINEL